MSDIVDRLRNQSILDVWHPMMLEAADDIERQRKVISATIEDCQYLKDKQIEATAEIEKLKQFHTDVAFELRGARDEIRFLRQAMHDIYEVYAGSEGFIPQYCAEAYLHGLVKEMADIAAKHKRAAAAAIRE